MNKTILDLQNFEAREFLLLGDVYCNIHFPDHFTFQKHIESAVSRIGQAVFEKDVLLTAKSESEVNHSLYGNKDGKYAWRKYEIINPLLYVSTVNAITEINNWKILKERFSAFQTPNISCLNLPLGIKNKKRRARAEMSRWTADIEYKSLALSMEYNFIYHTDISDCYGSIYTHSIAWAIHTKPVAKTNKNNYSLLGNKLDQHIQAMRNGQTNGIPQGSILMDFIAELILGYADLELHNKLKDLLKDNQYKILRYRDDYRIFVKESIHGEIILRTLSEVLLELGFRLNVAKTYSSQDVISGSVKEDKLNTLHYVFKDKITNSNDLIGHLLILQQISRRYPNAGVVRKKLNKLQNKRLPRTAYHSIGVVNAIVGILLDVGHYSPISFPSITALIATYAAHLSVEERKTLLRSIQNKMKSLPHSGLTEIWIQRMALGLKFKMDFKETLCRSVYEPELSLFNSNWVGDESRKENISCVKQGVINKIKWKIKSDEVAYLNQPSL